MLESEEGRYHVLGSCNYCGSLNTDVTATARDNGLVSEARQYCYSCGFEDYWSYGFYESGQDMEGKCEKYDE